MRKLLLLSTAALALTSPARAEPQTVVVADLIRPELIVVTATRTPQMINLTGASIDVITGDEIKRQQTVAVTDILGQTAGVTLTRTGGMGQTTGVLLRGANSGQSLFLIDGVRLEDPSNTDGGAVLQDVLVNNIDRIEVLRGPQSTLYGSDAIGGVVNILSKRGGDEPFTLTAMAEGGSFDTWHGNAAVTGTADIVEYGAAVNWFDTNGTSAADSRNGNSNSEADGYRNFGATLNTRVHVTDDISVDVRGYYTDSHIDFDGFAPPFFSFGDTPEFGKNRLYAGYGGLNVTLFDGKFDNRFAVIGLSSDRQNFGNFDFFTSAFSPTINFFGKGGSARFEYEGVFDLDEDNQFTFGAETQNTTLSTHSVFDLTPLNGGGRNVTGYYGQWQSTLFDALTLTGGIRYDDDSEFGGYTSGKINAAYNIDATGTTIRGNWGNGFKAPSLYELFSDFSNPTTALKPESANGWEVGADQMFSDGTMKASVTYFDTHYTNLIDFFSCFGVTSPECTLRAFAGGYYFNVNKAHTTGVEAKLTMQPSDTLTVTLNLTTLTAKNTTSGFALARRPDYQVNGEFTWTPTEAISLGTTLSFVGPRFNDAFGFTELESSVVANVFASYKFDEHWEVFGRVENLLDEKSEPVGGYGRPGRAFYAGLRAAL